MGGCWCSSPRHFSSLHADRRLPHQQAIARSRTRFAESASYQPVAPLESAARHPILPKRDGLRNPTLPRSYALSLLGRLFTLEGPEKTVAWSANKKEFGSSVAVTRGAPSGAARSQASCVLLESYDHFSLSMSLF